MAARVTFADVIRQEQGEYVILLLYKEAEQVMGIWTGFYEGTTLAWIAAERPNIWGGRRLPGIHEFLKDTLDAAGAKIAGTVIHSLETHWGLFTGGMKPPPL